MLSQKRTWIGLVLIVLLFWFLFRNIDLGKLLEAVGRFEIPWLLPALVVYSLGYLIRSLRWQVLLSPIKRCSFWNLLSVLLIGFAVNNLLPARLGELYRAHLNGKKEGISRSASLATIILERLFDGLAMLLLLFLALHLRSTTGTPLSPTMESVVEKATYLFIAAFLVFFSVLIFKERTIRILNYMISHAPRKHHDILEKISHTFLDGLNILKNAKETLIVLLTSLAAWTCEFSSFYFIAIGFHLAPEPIHFNSAALLMVITNLFLMIPGTPGGLGLFENVGCKYLSLYPIQQETAVAYILIVHLFVLIPITLAGLYALSREGLSLGSLGNDKGRKK